MTKYYTPNIEEFHVGFEYEYKDFRRKWYKHTLDWDDTIRVADNAATDTDENPFAGWENLNHFRVKYLDKEDIESLGFKLTQNLADDFEFEWHIEREGDGEIGVFIDEYDLSKEINIELFGVYFKVKNKSELVKLMKQLHLI